MLLSMFSYLCVILGVLYYAFYIEAQFGVLMLAFLILIPVFSVLITLYGRKKIRLSFVLRQMAHKNESVILATRTEKITKLPLPFLRYTILPDAHFSTQPIDAQLALGSEDKTDRLHELIPTICGNAKVHLIQPRLTGYLGFLNCSLEMNTEADLMILPEIPDMSTDNQLFYALTASSEISEDEDDNTQITYNSFNRIAGYAHREYQLGDPLKRINWKLSSKKDQLMVRMDESLSITKTAVIMDFQRASSFDDNERSLLIEQRVMEGALGILAHCAQQQFGCNFYYYAHNGWNEIPIDSREQVESLTVSVMEHGYGSIPERFSLLFSQNQTSGVSLIFTTSPDAELLALAQTLKGVVHIVLPKEMIPPSCASVQFWQISEDYRIVPMNHTGNGGN